MTKIEELKQDLLDRYNMSWEVENYHEIYDTMRLVNEAKQNFKNTLETLINLIYEEKTQKEEIPTEKSKRPNKGEFTIG